MNYKIVTEFPNDIFYNKGDVCISIYIPTHRYVVGSQKDKILFKNQIQKAEKSLLQKYSKKEVAEILNPLNELLDDFVFWNRTKDGLAIFLNRDDFIIYVLSRNIKELTIVSDNFHIKPLIRVYQSMDKYYVLGVNRGHFKLFYGDRYGLNEIEDSKEMPDDMRKEYDLEVLDLSKDVEYMFKTGSNRDEVSKETTKFLRNVDKYILEFYSKPTEAPLVLVALPQYQGEFRKITNNRFLTTTGVSKDFEAMKIEEIKEESWNIIEKTYLEETKKLVNRFLNNKGDGLASDNIIDIAKKVLAGRIDTLLLESDKLIPGKLNLETGEITEDDLDNVEINDILNDIGELVLENKGNVVVLPKERMPTDIGIAAIYRY